MGRIGTCRFNSSFDSKGSASKNSSEGGPSAWGVWAAQAEVRRQLQVRLLPLTHPGLLRGWRCWQQESAQRSAELTRVAAQLARLVHRKLACG